MKAQIKTKWTQALRSGNYKQGRENLYHDGAFCCLGVLTDIYLNETNQQWRHCVGLLYSFEGEGGFLPLSVMKWSGLTENNPYVGGDNLTSWNDNHQASFNEIADLIDKFIESD